jgi:two-component system response regulator (stage 0 sporulation protein F)
MANILIVDDQLYVRDLFSDELADQGYQISSLSDAESVRRHLKSLRPDLVLLDLCLDGPNGFEVLDDIKCNYPRLPVIILTAYDSFRDDPRLSQADAYVIKSGDLTELKRKIANVVMRMPETDDITEAQKCSRQVGMADHYPRTIKTQHEGNAK